MLVEKIAKEAGAAPSCISHVINTASRRYKTYPIAKRSGGRRWIDQPAPVLKYLQRWIVRNVIVHLPVHQSVNSYRKGDNILNNARAHVENSYLLKMDFQDFFPSITAADIENLLSRNQDIPVISELSDADRRALLSIVCRYDRLTIGAPSSPAISNSVLFEFDSKTASMCEQLSVVYTRYADDLAFSSNVPNVLCDIPELLTGILREMPSPSILINHDKTLFTSRKHRRSLTGLILTPDRRVSIGRNNKRWVKSACHRYRNKDLTAEEASRLRGYLSFVRSVEPDFIGRLEEKYGAGLIDDILKFPLISLKAWDDLE